MNERAVASVAPCMLMPARTWPAVRLSLQAVAATAVLCAALPATAADLDRLLAPGAAYAQVSPRSAPDLGAVRRPNPAVSNDSPSGISPNPNNDTAGAGTASGTVDIPLPTSAPPRVGLFPDFGATLLNKGIDIHGIAFDHFLANPSTGVKIGEVSNLAVIAPAVDVDLQRLVGLPGGNIHVQATFFALKADIPSIITKTGGFLTGFQTTPAPVTQVLSVLTYEQKLFDDRLSVEFGRTNAYRFFFLPNSLDYFTHFSSVIQTSGDLASNPYPVWGGRATYHFTPEWFVQGGVFEDNYRRAVSNGNNFGVAQNSGFVSIGEVGYRSEFNNAQYPANFEAGVLFDARHGSRTNLKGSGIPSNPITAARNYGNGGAVYFEGLKVIYRGERGAYGPPKNISIYGSIQESIDQPQPFQFETLAGITATGFIPGRPADAIGGQVHLSRLSNVEANYETRLIQRYEGRGSTVTQQRNGFAFELNGNIQVTQAIAIRPIVEYFVNPDTYYSVAAPHKPGRDGFEAGLFATVALGRLIGTSLKPF